MTTCQAKGSKGILARLLPARARVARCLVIVSLLACGCGGQADDGEPDKPCILGEGAGLVVMSIEHPPSTCYAMKAPAYWCCLP